MGSVFAPSKSFDNDLRPGTPSATPTRVRTAGGGAGDGLSAISTADQSPFSAESSALRSSSASDRASAADSSCEQTKHDVRVKFPKRKLKKTHRLDAKSALLIEFTPRLRGVVPRGQQLLVRGTCPRARKTPRGRAFRFRRRHEGTQLSRPVRLERRIRRLQFGLCGFKRRRRGGFAGLRVDLGSTRGGALGAGGGRACLREFRARRC